MIVYTFTVRTHEGAFVESDTASGNTPRTAQAAKAAALRWLNLQYPPEHYSITVSKSKA